MKGLCYGANPNKPGRHSDELGWFMPKMEVLKILPQAGEALKSGIKIRQIRYGSLSLGTLKVVGRHLRGRYLRPRTLLDCALVLLGTSILNPTSKPPFLFGCPNKELIELKVPAKQGDLFQLRAMNWGNDCAEVLITRDDSVVYLGEIRYSSLATEAPSTEEEEDK